MAPSWTPVARVLRVSSVLVFLLAAWWLVPRPEPGARLTSAARVVVIDASASVRRTRPGWSAWVRERLVAEARAALAAGEDLGVVAYARDVERLRPAAPPGELLEALRGGTARPFDPRPGGANGRDDASRLCDALRVASTDVLAGGRAPGRIVLLGGDGWTGEDPHSLLATLARAGVTVSHHATPPAELPDLALTALDVPPRVEAGAPLTARVELGVRAPLPAAAEAELVLELSGVGPRREKHVPLDATAVAAAFAAGHALELAVPLGEVALGRTEVSARVELRGATDAVPENDRLTAATRAEGELVVLVAAPSERLDEARDWLVPARRSALAGVQFLFVEPQGVAPLLAEVDALVTFDVSLDELPGALLEAFLDEGGGWLATAGAGFLGGWAPTRPDTGLRARLPLEPAPPEGGPRDVILLVDGSGSMEGEPFDMVRAACLDLVRAALPTDEVTLRFFTSRLHPREVVKPRDVAGAPTNGSTAPARAEAAARKLLELHVPSGDTEILASLEDLVRERRGQETEALVLLLSDGLERSLDSHPEQHAADLLVACTEERIGLRPIAMGARADLGFLGRLTRPGEAVLTPDGLDELRTLFRRMITAARCRAGAELALRWTALPPGSLAREVAGAPREELPEPLSLERFVLARERAGAEVLWRADRGEPVLGVWRTGLGRAALFGSLPLEGWAPGYTHRLGMGEPVRFANLLRWLARGPVRPDRPVAELGPEELVVTGLDATWPARVVARVRAGVLDGAAQLAELELAPPLQAFAHAPLSERRARWSPAGTGVSPGTPWVVELEREDGAAPVLLPVVAGPAEEFIGADQPLVPVLASTTGSERGHGGSRPERLRAHPAGPWALALGGLLLFVGFLVRRVPRG